MTLAKDLALLLGVLICAIGGAAAADYGPISIVFGLFIGAPLLLWALLTR